MKEDELESAIKGAEQSVSFFGAGKEKQKTRERWVVEHFLHGLGVAFQPSDIVQPEHDPPDVEFRGAAFEVKEVQEPGRRRHEEYKQRLARARSANSAQDLLEEFTPWDVSAIAICDQLSAETQDLSAGKYCSERVRRGLDLLFYVNLDMETAWGIKGDLPSDLSPLNDLGWRSVSFLHGSATSCVLVATLEAAEFLRQARGQILRGSVPET